MRDTIIGGASNAGATKKVISLSCMYTPYTLDTYVTFVSDMWEENIIEYLSDEHKRKLTYDDIEWEYDHKGLVKMLFNNWIALMRDNIIDDVILAIEPDGEPWSPREYNFATDNGNVHFTVNHDALVAYIAQNRADYDVNKIASCSGFVWFGDEDQTMLNYYLHHKSLTDYSEDAYLSDQNDMLYSNGKWDDVISYTVKNHE